MCLPMQALDNGPTAAAEQPTLSHQLECGQCHHNPAFLQQRTASLCSLRVQCTVLVRHNNAKVLNLSKCKFQKHEKLVPASKLQSLSKKCFLNTTIISTAQRTSRTTGTITCSWCNWCFQWRTPCKEFQVLLSLPKFCHIKHRLKFSLNNGFYQDVGSTSCYLHEG